MKTEIIKKEKSIAAVQSEELIITDAQSALDFLMSVRYETGCDRIIINKEAITEDFFDLNTCLAGEVLQKFVNYHIKLAIVGDFGSYTSKSLKDFIYESNKGRHIFFVSTRQQAVDIISNA